MDIYIFSGGFCAFFGKNCYRGVWGRLMHGKRSLSKEKSLKPLRFQAFSGAGNVTRTHDLLITNQLLYRLSYASNFCRFLGSLCILSRRAAVVNRNCRYFAPGLRLFRFSSGKLSRWYGRSRAPPLQYLMSYARGNPSRPNWLIQKCIRRETWYGSGHFTIM